MKYKIDKKLVFVLDPVSGEDDLAGDESNITCMLAPIFDLFIADIEVVIRNSIDQVEYEIAARKALPCICFLHLEEKSDLKGILKIKNKFPKIIYYVFDLKDISGEFEFFKATNIFNLK